MPAKNAKFRRFKILVLIICLIIMGVIFYFQRNVTRVLISISEATIRSITTVAVNDAIYYTLNDVMRYEDLITIERDAEGNVTSITTDSLKINRIARDTAYLSQENLTKMSAEGIMVPIGALTGIEALAGFGNKINIKIIPISNVECRFVSKFERRDKSNQTLHLSRNRLGYFDNTAVEIDKPRFDNRSARLRKRYNGQNSGYISASVMGGFKRRARSGR